MNKPAVKSIGKDQEKLELMSKKFIDEVMEPSIEKMQLKEHEKFQLKWLITNNLIVTTLGAALYVQKKDPNLPCFTKLNEMYLDAMEEAVQLVEEFFVEHEQKN